MNIFYLSFFLLTLVDARGIAGAWERAALWRAYQLEVSITGGPTTKIAKGCRGTDIGGSCNINEFLQFIHAAEMKPMPKVSGKNVEELVESMNKGYDQNPKDPNVLTGMKNDYERPRILEPKSNERLTQVNLFEMLAKRTRDVWNSIKAPNEKQVAMLADTDKSLLAVRQHRSREWGLYFRPVVEKSGMKAVIKTVIIGGKKYTNVFDFEATKKANRGREQELDRLMKSHHKNLNHEGHFKIITSVIKAGRILGHCKRSPVGPRTMTWARRWTEHFSGAVDHFVEIGARIGSRCLGYFEGLNPVLR